MPSSSVTAHGTLRAGILVGVCVCIVTVVYSLCWYPGILSFPGTPGFLAVFLAGVTFYAYAGVRWTRITTRDDLLVLRRGAQWGVAIGLAWTVEVIGGNLILPHSLGARIGIVAAAVAAILPVVAGAHGAAATGRLNTGARIGFWSGVVSGLITFAALAAVGFVVVHVPGFPGLETPHNATMALTAEELAAFNIGDYLAGGVSHLVLIGAPFCTAAGFVGGLLMRDSNRISSQVSDHP